ncbi:hypothetical protein D3C76_1580180 [compost metagenome]
MAPKPVNVVMGLSGVRLTVAELSALGVKRISVGSSMARAAYGAFFKAAEEVVERGSFDFAERAMPFAQMNQLFKR